MGFIATVRAHHLLCARYFRGYGYSPAFIRRVRRTLALWNGRPQTPVIISTADDTWCRACPNCGTEACNKASDRDSRVLEFLNLAPGTTLIWAAARELVGQKIDARAAACSCAGCPWLAGGYCRW